MIIEGSTHGSAKNLARYLLDAKPGETPFLQELRDAATENLHEALTDWELCGRSLTKGQKVLFHAYIRLPKGEFLAEDQWLAVVERLEEKLGLGNCGRAVIGHSGEKGLHLHVAWSRFDPLTGKLASLSWDRRAFHEVARWAEKEYQLSPVESAPKRERKRRMSDREIRAFKDRGVAKELAEKVIRAAWRASDSGEEFVQHCKALGVEIRHGDKRDFVAVVKGIKINPVRLLDGVTTAAFRAKMVDAEIERETQDGGEQARRRRASELPAVSANDLLSTAEKPKQGFTKKHRKLTPRLRPKIWFGDPGI